MILDLFFPLLFPSTIEDEFEGEDDLKNGRLTLPLLSMRVPQAQGLAPVASSSAGPRPGQPARRGR
jgi:hypothetical protein